MHSQSLEWNLGVKYFVCVQLNVHSKDFLIIGNVFLKLRIFIDAFIKVTQCNYYNFYNLILLLLFIIQYVGVL